MRRDQAALSAPFSRPHDLAAARTTFMAMNWWFLMAGLGALASAAGHAFAGEKMFHRPMRAALSDRLHQGVLDNLWHIVTVHFAVSGIALLFLGLGRGDALLASAVGLQFAAYAGVALGISLHLGAVTRLPQWMLFAVVALLTAVGALSPQGGVR